MGTDLTDAESAYHVQEVANALKSLLFERATAISRVTAATTITLFVVQDERIRQLTPPETFHRCLRHRTASPTRAIPTPSPSPTAWRRCCVAGASSPEGDDGTGAGDGVRRRGESDPVGFNTDDYRPEGVTVYNFEVDGNHTYSVGDGVGEVDVYTREEATAALGTIRDALSKGSFPY